MDIKKMNIPTLDGPNWGQFSIHLQAAAHILDVWEVIWGEILTPAPNPTYDLLTKPTHPGVQTSAADLTTYNAAKAVWNKKNAQALGLIQATILPVIWQNYVCSIWCSKWFVGCLRGWIWKSRGSINLLVSDTVLYWHPNLGTLSVESEVFPVPF